MSGGWFTTFLNCRLCVGGQLVEDQFVVSDDTGLILPRTGYIGGDAVDLEEGIIAPGFLELQTNGLLGFHFTHFTDKTQYAGEIDKAAKFLVTQGVTGFWATVPTVSSDDFKKVGQDSVLPISSLWSISRSYSTFHISFPLNRAFRHLGASHFRTGLYITVDARSPSDFLIQI